MSQVVTIVPETCNECFVRNIRSCEHLSARKSESYDKNIGLEREFEEVLRLLANVRGKVLSLERKLINK